MATPMMINLLLLSFMTGCLSLAFNHFGKKGMIFEFYFNFLRKLRYPNMFKNPEEHCIEEHKIAEWIQEENQFWRYLTKPLGLCPFCHGTWLHIAVYFIVYPFDLTAFAVFLGIGVNWLVIRIGETLWP